MPDDDLIFQKHKSLLSFTFARIFVTGGVWRSYMGVFSLGGVNSNGKSESKSNGNIMEWVGYPFCDGNGNGIQNTHVIDFAVAIAIAADTPPM